jgi:hypothetical protein
MLSQLFIDILQIIVVVVETTVVVEEVRIAMYTMLIQFLIDIL